jgi:hypothetical protein
MKRLLLLPLLFLGALSMAAEEPADKKPQEEEDLIPAAIPAHVRYTQPTLDDAKSARAKLAKEYEQGAEALQVKRPLMICHKTWARIEKLGLIKPETGVKMTGISPDGAQVEGRAYREAAEISIVWKFLRERLQQTADTKTKIRTPNREEITDYWAQIAWDIENAPMFVVEHGEERILVVFAKDEPFQVCDLGKPKKAPEPEGKAAGDDESTDASKPKPEEPGK